MFVRVHIVYPGITRGRGKTEVMLLQLLGRILQECALAPASHPVPSGGAEPCPLRLQAPVLVLFLHQSWTPAWCHGPASGGCLQIHQGKKYLRKEQREQAGSAGYACRGKGSKEQSGPHSGQSQSPSSPPALSVGWGGEQEQKSGSLINVPKHWH